MRVLIIANSKFGGGSSGSDKIYESFKKHWPVVFTEHHVSCDYHPFIFCYLQRIIIGCFMASIEPVVLRRLGVDPATATGPLITTITDLLSNLVYFSLATYLLVR